MTRVVVPVRHPLSNNSKRTLEKAIDIAAEKQAELTVLHVNLYQDGRSITRSDLKQAVEREFGRLARVRYVVRTGFLVEETILDEVAAEDADLVVIGHKQASRWRRVFRRVTRNPDIEKFLTEKLDCAVITVSET